MKLALGLTRVAPTLQTKGENLKVTDDERRNK
ncbi:hypothetical protein LMED105_10590 [Limnobacter sp. MED105]|nr:hypothetical protein LMED105_10590 [Limnobacter sp. MED105]